MDIMSIGEMVIDFLPGGEPGVYIRKPGGAPANMAIAMARGGCDAGFCGKVGDDDFGRFLSLRPQARRGYVSLSSGHTGRPPG